MRPYESCMATRKMTVMSITYFKFRYNDKEIESKVEELRQILSEQAGIASKDNKDGKPTYVHVSLGF